MDNHILATYTQKHHMDIDVLHIALEYAQAALGGIAAVTTQMVSAQNGFAPPKGQHYKTGIITPYYRNFYPNDAQLVATIQHLFNDESVETDIYCRLHDGNPHYLIAPRGVYQNLFEVPNVNFFYDDTRSVKFVDRLKYYNSAVAAYVHSMSSTHSIAKPRFLVLHSWSGTLIPKLLEEVYANSKIMNILVLHSYITDQARLHSTQLTGIGLTMTPGNHMLTAIGMQNAHKIIAVSKNFLQEALSYRGSDLNCIALKKILSLQHAKGNVAAILNGIDYYSLCPLGTLIKDKTDIYAEKLRLKIEVSKLLNAQSETWKINPTLPVILFIGRLVRGKGIDTFPKLLDIVKDRAVFFALGRGPCAQLTAIMTGPYQKTNNVFISNSEQDQTRYKHLMRACADFTFVPSHQETCGLVALEGFANGALCITTGVGGLKDFIELCVYTDPDNIRGNSFIYNNTMTNSDASKANGNATLTSALNAVLEFAEHTTPRQKSMVFSRIMTTAQRFDWAAPQGAIEQYTAVFSALTQRTKAKANDQAETNHAGQNPKKTRKNSKTWINSCNLL